MSKSTHNCQMIDFFFSGRAGLSRDALWKWNRQREHV